MAFRFTLRRRALCKALVVCAAGMIGIAPAAAATPFTLSAHYTVSMTHIGVGEISWTVHFSGNSYIASADGNASGVFSVLVKGKGEVTTHGVLDGDRLVPSRVTTSVIDDDGRDDVQMTFEDGALKEVSADTPSPKDNRIPVTPDLLHDVADPLSAMLIPVEADVLAHANCDRTLRIFDGRRRYDLALSFKRVDKMKIERGYAGAVLVCRVVLRPVAGYNPKSLPVRYLAGKLDLEIWFAPVAGAGVMAPVRALMPTLIGTMDILADAFEAALPQSAKKREPPPQQPCPAPTAGATNCNGGASDSAR